MFNQFPKRTGIYHIKDNIEQLELRLYFRHVNSLLKLPKFDYNKTVNGEWHGQRNQIEYKSTPSEDDIKIVSIKWQEKLFSLSEEELYKEAKNCVTETQRKYHEWLLEKTSAECDTTEKIELNKSSSRRRRKKRTKKHRKFDTKSNVIMKACEIHTYVHEDNFQVDEKGEMATETAVHMYIYAALDVDTQLVHLKWYPNERMLHIYPDFNSFTHNPYFIEIDKDYRHLYAYAIENISPAREISRANDLSLYLQLPQYAELPHWRTDEERSALFCMPPKRTRRVSLLLELRDAYDFDYDGLHIRYHIQLPSNTIHEEGLLEASTHTSYISESNIHHFGYNWQLTLLCEEEYDAADLLHIYFEVISIDSWERERVEGYAHLAICLVNARSIELHRLQCLSPVLNFWASLERFFIGGRRKFNFKHFFGHLQKNDHTIDEYDDQFDISLGFHNLYGCRMKSTGCLTLSYQRFTQNNYELLEPSTNRRSGMTLDDIMCAYREARNRLEALILK